MTTMVAMIGVNGTSVRNECRNPRSADSPLRMEQWKKARERSETDVGLGQGPPDVCRTCVPAASFSFSFSFSQQIHTHIK